MKKFRGILQTKKIEIFFLIVILLGSFVLRLYRFDSPVADWHSWRQADTSMVSRNFIQEGFTILVPRFNDLSKGVSLMDNPGGYRFVEFPIYNILQAGSFSVFHYFTLEEWGRLISILSSVATTFFLYALVKKNVSKRAAFFTAAFYAFIPYNIYYGRTLLPDTTTVTAMMGALYFLDLWLDRKFLIFYLVSLFLSASALLLKPFVLFFTLPFLFLIFRRYKFNSLTNPYIWAYVIGALAPLMFWRLWMSQYPQGVPRNDWLFNGNNIRFKGAFFNWIFAERIGRMILGYFGLPFVIVGIISAIKKEGLLFHGFLIGVLAYVTIIATGNIQHDYYQILIIPTLAIFFGKGVDVMLDASNTVFNKYVARIVVIVSIFFMFAFSWFVVRDFFNVQHMEVVIAGKEADTILPKDARVIAPFAGDTTFLYYINRRGWPVFDRTLPEFMEVGATHMVFANPGEPELNFQHYFKTVAKNPGLVIYDLRAPLLPLDSKVPASSSAILN